MTVDKETLLKENDKKQLVDAALAMQHDLEDVATAYDRSYPEMLAPSRIKKMRKDQLADYIEYMDEEMFRIVDSARKTHAPKGTIEQQTSLWQKVKAFFRELLLRW